MLARRGCDDCCLLEQTTIYFSINEDAHVDWPFEPWSNASQRAMVDFITGMDRQFKIIVEKHTDGYVAYPLGLKGIVVGEGDSYEEALADVKSAIQFHIQTFGNDVLPDDSPLIEAFIEEATISA